MNWIARQYPNKGTWMEENGLYFIYVNDNGRFDVTGRHPSLSDSPQFESGGSHITLKEAQRHCEVYEVCFGDF